VNSFDDLHELLENNTIDAFVLGQYQAEHRLGSISEDFAVEVDQTEPISVGIIFDAPPAYDGLRNCLRRRIFLRVLDNGAQLQRKMAHRRDVQVTPFEVAENAFGGDDSVYKLVVAAGAVALVVAVAGVIDLIVLKYISRIKKKVTKAEEIRSDNAKELLAVV
jgi:hypothetical protein